MSAAQNECEEKKRLFERSRGDLRTAEQRERQATANVRNQEQKVAAEERHLQKCRDEEREANRIQQQLQHEADELEADVKFAELALQIADAALTAAIAAVSWTIIGAFIAMGVKTAAVAAANYALNQLRESLQTKKTALSQQIEKHKGAKEKRQVSEATLTTDRTNLETRKGELATRKAEMTTVQQQHEQQKSAFDAATNKTKDLRTQRATIQESKSTKYKEIQTKESDAAQQSNTMTVMKMNIDQLTKDQSQCQEKLQRIDGQMKLSQTDVDLKSKDYATKNGHVEQLKGNQTQLKTTLDNTQTQMESNENRLTGALRDRHQVENDLTNINAEMNMSNQSIFELQSDMGREKVQLGQMTELKKKADYEFEKCQRTLETTKTNLENAETSRVANVQNLQSAHNGFVGHQQRVEQSRFQQTQISDELRWTEDRRQQYENNQNALQRSMENAQEKSELVQTRLKPIIEQLGQGQKSRQDLEKEIVQNENDISITEKNRIKLAESSEKLQKHFDEGSVRQNEYLKQLHADQRLQDDLEARIIDNQSKINRCKLEILKATKEKEMKVLEKSEYQEKQAGYPNYTEEEAKEAEKQLKNQENVKPQTTSHTSKHTKEREQLNYK